MSKITNEMHYKTAEERIAAFNAWCPRNKRSEIGCGSCKLKHIVTESSDCMAYWLALEAEEEKLEPCPFCGGKCVEATPCEEHPHIVKCIECGYATPENAYETFADAVAAHNRVARAVMDAKKGEAKK